MNAVFDVTSFAALCPVKTVRLRRVQRAANMHRYYTVTVARDLFGAAVVMCRWGRVGRSGQMQEHLCTTLEAAQALAQRLVGKKRARGYDIDGTAPAGPVVRAAPSARATKPRRRRPVALATATRQLSLFAPQETAITSDHASAPVAPPPPPQSAPHGVVVTGPLIGGLANPTMEILGKPATPTEQERALAMLTLAARLRGLSLARGVASRTLPMR